MPRKKGEAGACAFLLVTSVSCYGKCSKRRRHAQALEVVPVPLFLCLSSVFFEVVHAGTGDTEHKTPLVLPIERSAHVVEAKNSDFLYCGRRSPPSDAPADPLILILF